MICIHTCPSGFTQVIARPFINFGVGTFLFLSGYLTREENWNSSRMWKRIRRVLIPYVIWTVIYTLFSRKPEDIVYNLFTASSSAQMYYCLVYIQIVLLTGLFFKGLRNKAWTVVLIILSPLSFLFKYMQIFSGVEISGTANLIYGICFVPWVWYYVVGLCLRKHERTFSQKALICFLLISVFLQIGEGWTWFRTGDANCGTQLKISSWLTTTIVCLICYRAIRKKSGNLSNPAKAAKLIGDYSFGIYLSHMEVIGVLAHIPGYQNMPYVVNSVIVLVISLVCCVIADRLFRKIKIGNTSLSTALGLR